MAKKRNSDFDDLFAEEQREDDKAKPELNVDSLEARVLLSATCGNVEVDPASEPEIQDCGDLGLHHDLLGDYAAVGEDLLADYEPALEPELETPAEPTYEPPVDETPVYEEEPPVVEREPVLLTEPSDDEIVVVDSVLPYEPVDFAVVDDDASRPSAMDAPVE